MSDTPHTVTLGCRLNSYESERMARLAQEAGHPNAVIINTCAVTGEAVRQSRQAIRRAAKDRPGAPVYVTGCAAQLDPDAFAAMPQVTRVIGNGEKLTVKAWQTDGPVTDVFAETVLTKAPAALGPLTVRAHLEVQNGCNHRCTFCIIPFGRGQARSKASADIVAEARAMAESGAREIVLTGVDLTSYGPDLGEGVTLSDAIEALLAALPSSIRLRLSSIDGAEVDERLFDLVTQEERIAPHLHLSLQAGSDMILKRMKRRHLRHDAIELCQRLKSARPDIAFGADLIAGFPTETDNMFADTLSLVDECALSFVHVFPFSPRAGTPAAKMPPVERTIVKARAAELREKAHAALSRHLSSKCGTQTTMLVESVRDGRLLGKAPDFTDITCSGPGAAGDLIRVHLIEANGGLMLAQTA
ncbi:tRNA (N(6)-L-threonylcarbamoyladenosine(37)-C(2))-methylthiotransferase MtaB [Parvularcula sp. LCG005]|uniref:tRNA (N(6)-L-threonylcarbamoyladenosine(37)-C(2))- methylthiotransferase MtaB n=1 Tax=Parvularcula sp. LCG005 TaxID=3078805 RepID=UPI0029433A93|nr:tRNA (N(6)-L-threonylcarbamoyladenosine(37)-C(2))-methylthiotransferase MtaB [Parvularcula sp. LCG005]WOI53400.1 tRNA (N(6)-L-threonylcarbamoyladenosine(37)-C(2))-methylthiotransferase MtaB [Parvularcula sp. LCG005]